MKNRFLVGAIAVGLLFSAAAAFASAQDYRFELAAPPAKAGDATIVKVRLVHASHGHPMEGAIVFQSRLDMGPDGMASMTAPVKPIPSAGEPGVYAFEARPTMAGNWALILSAKVQGEPETVKGSVTIPVGK